MVQADDLGMVEYTYVVIAAALGVIGSVFTLLVLQKGENAQARRSAQAHDAAQDRDPPVSLGETYEFGIKEFTTHHSGERIAVGKVEGFVLFTEDIPGTVTEGDVIRARVLSFNDGRTSADATYEGSA